MTGFLSNPCATHPDAQRKVTHFGRLGNAHQAFWPFLCRDVASSLSLSLALPLIVQQFSSEAFALYSRYGKTQKMASRVSVETSRVPFETQVPFRSPCLVSVPFDASLPHLPRVSLGTTRLPVELHSDQSAMAPPVLTHDLALEIQESREIDGQSWISLCVF